ncbi:MAG: right-handed parallel beta-helix repeat-containing protein, partial [Phycisphaerales bacterium]
GGMYNDGTSSPTVTNCTFSGNSARVDGGGMYNYDNSSPTVTNCTFSGNSARDYGGGMYNYDNSSPSVTNCTFVENSAPNGRAVACDSYEQDRPSDVDMIDCILWNGADEIWNNDGSTITITYSDIQGGWPGEGNIDADPLFVRAPDDGGDGWGDDPDTPEDEGANDDYGDLHLQDGSPCINTGSPNDIDRWHDVDGEERTQQCRVDMGVDETPYLLADCNDNDLDDIECDITEGTSKDCNGNWIPDECEMLSGTVYVHDNATGGADDGSSWSDAFVELHNALTYAECRGDVTRIRVGEGTYVPDTTGLADPREATFQLQSGVSVLGGFAGAGTADPDERDPENYETVLTGDLGHDDVAVACTQNSPDCDANGGLCVDNNCIIPANNTDNTYHVVTGNGTDITAVIDGFTVTGGNASGSQPHDIGGGMYNHSGSPTVSDCTFTGNAATRGAGMLNNASAAAVNNCAFRGNSASVHGGGVYNVNGSGIRLETCAFSANRALSWGGAIYNNASHPTVTNCTFTGNIASLQGGAMQNWIASPTVVNCRFRGNEAPHGGAIFSRSDSYPKVTNCTFTGNTGDYGGALYNEWYGIPTVTGCTFSGNAGAVQGGAVYTSANAGITISNSILWGDTGGEIVSVDGGTATVRYSGIQGGYDGTGNIDADPLFVRDPDPGPDGTWDGVADDHGDLHLSPGSPCIDAADNTSVPADAADLDGDADTAEPTPFDLDLHPRFVNDLATDDTGNPSAEIPDRIVDMGAYEAPTAGDCDGDGYVCLLDYEVLVSCMTGPGGEVTPACSMLDLDRDGDVDLSDYGAFQCWFTGGAP